MHIHFHIGKVCVAYVGRFIPSIHRIDSLGKLGRASLINATCHRKNGHIRTPWLKLLKARKGINLESELHV